MKYIEKTPTGISESYLLKASDNIVTLYCHLVYQFKMVTSRVEETELISEAE